ncbi:MAG: hypothetical protein R3299_00460 [Arenibacter sp.]|nr:hypothetical protein [Arenibacter sp.]
MKKEVKTISKWAGMVFLGLTVLLSCSKDEDGNELGDLSGDSYISMKVNGKLWTSDLAGVTAFYNEAKEENYGSFIVSLAGFKCEECDTETVLSEEVDTLNIVIAVTIDKYKNPKGTYMARSFNDINYHSKEGSFVVFIKSNLEKELWDYYYSEDFTDKMNSKGNVLIKDFKTGTFGLNGEEIKGYAYLSGAFEYEVYKDRRENGSLEKLVITEGKFQLNELSFLKDLF